jgi:hypothetical protein
VVVEKETVKKTFKVLVVGNSKCGKTSIINRYANDDFTGKYNITIGADYTRKVRGAQTRPTLLPTLTPTPKKHHHQHHHHCYCHRPPFFLFRLSSGMRAPKFGCSCGTLLDR